MDPKPQQCEIKEKHEKMKMKIKHEEICLKENNIQAYDKQ